MKVAHILRHYDPNAFGGTEAHILRLVEGLRHHNIQSVVFCPKRPLSGDDPLRSAAIEMRTFHAFLPVIGLPAAERKRLLAVGGNIVSLDAPIRLFLEKDVDIFHTHALRRIGGAARLAARLRGLPYVVSIHGGYLALPAEVERSFHPSTHGGVDLGRPLGLLLGSRRVVDDADAIIVFNRTEESLLRQRYPEKLVRFIPHGVIPGRYEKDFRDVALHAFPQLRERLVVLCVGRLHPAKNQSLLLDCLEKVAKEVPDVLLVLVGPKVDERYGAALESRAEEGELRGRVIFTGPLQPDSDLLVGLYQVATVVAMPSQAETFGLVFLEAWASGTPVVASRSAGPLDLVEEGEDGLLFDIGDREGCTQALLTLLRDPEKARLMGQKGREKVRRKYDLEASVLATIEIYHTVKRRVKG